MMMMVNIHTQILIIIIMSIHNVTFKTIKSFIFQIFTGQVGQLALELCTSHLVLTHFSQRYQVLSPEESVSVLLKYSCFCRFF